MLNVSLSEVLLVLLVAILAFKPQDLAAACANVGGWIWRLRQLLFSLQHDVLVERNSVKNMLIANGKDLISANKSHKYEENSTIRILPIQPTLDTSSVTTIQPQV